MSLPLVSICIPTYNGERFIAEAMDSAIAQTYGNLEVVVSDDASTDATLSIIETYKTKTDIPIQVYNHKPNGIGANWNHSIKKANGTYIKFLFQDDVLHPDCISEMIAVFNQNPNIGLVACKRNFIVEGEQNPTIKEWIDKYKNLQIQFESENKLTLVDKELFSRKDFLQSPMNKIGEPPTVMFRKNIIKEVGYFDESLKQILDYVFYYRILKIRPVAIINKSLVSFRIHENQTTNVNRSKDISDYQKYKRILYKEFLNLLHLSHKKKLVLKYSSKAKLKHQLKRVITKLCK